ncbi:MAG: PEGA domain-containing protein [Deltaproteobacteria bacterium]|nr:PEGA domain-containing protein [Deltaproteobacteria bacterium]
MSDGQGKGGGNKQSTDDRTLLDPLSSDELKALREARQRMQAKKGAVAHQIVIGPDTGEDIGDAPTRAMPALPTFEGNVSIDQIGTNPPHPASHGPRHVGGPPTEPMSVHGRATVPAAHTPQVGPPGAQPTAGNTGFGENTLLWMQPPKPPASAVVGGAATPDVLPKVSKKEAAKSKLKAAVVLIAIVVIGGALLFAALAPKPRGVLELHTNPPKAEVLIDGKKSSEVTPVKLTLSAGEHTIEVRLEGHQNEAFVALIEEGEEAHRKEVELTPISKPGLMTVSVQVQPVSASITFDDKVHTGRSFKMADVDPNKPHKIAVEAGGYVKIAQDVAPGELKADYSFVLQKDETIPQ